MILRFTRVPPVAPTRGEETEGPEAPAASTLMPWIVSTAILYEPAAKLFWGFLQKEISDARQKTKKGQSLL